MYVGPPGGRKILPNAAGMNVTRQRRPRQLSKASRNDLYSVGTRNPAGL
jgi:hypothetical protein